MNYILLDGRKAASSIKTALKAEIEKAKNDGKRPPGLAAILVGNNGASETYVASKVKACEHTGIYSELIRLPESVTETELLNEIEKLNTNPLIDGFIVQLPLPQHLDEQKILLAISPAKDVDGFHPENIGNLALHLPGFIPATPKGIMLLLEQFGIETSGKHAVIIGRSHIVGLPMSLLLSRNDYPGNCTVTLCHSKTQNLKEFTLKADIIIAALGRPLFLKSDMVKKGSVVIDVGITRVVNPESATGYTIQGDVDFDAVAPLTSAITPVPGGVGAMTIAALLVNTIESWRKKNSNA